MIWLFQGHFSSQCTWYGECDSNVFFLSSSFLVSGERRISASKSLVDTVIMCSKFHNKPETCILRCLWSIFAQSTFILLTNVAMIHAFKVQPMHISRQMNERLIRSMSLSFSQAYRFVVVSYVLRIWSVQQTHRAAVFLQNRIYLHTCWYVYIHCLWKHTVCCDFCFNFVFFCFSYDTNKFINVNWLWYDVDILNARKEKPFALSMLCS